MKRYFFLLLILSIFNSCTTSSRVESDVVNEHSEHINRIENGLVKMLQIEGRELPTYSIEDRLKMMNIPGLSIAVVIDGKLAWARAYGYADVREDRKVTENTYFLAGSVSKPVSALAALNMTEEGTIGLDQNVNELLNSWKLPDNQFTKKEKVTLRRILNHTAGLTVWGFPGYDKGDDIPTVPQVLDGEGNTDSVRVYKEPGESWMYSGGGYTIMQLMMTDIEGKSFPEIMKERVLSPLGMDSSTFENPLPGSKHNLAATGYRGDGGEVEGKWPIYPEMAAAGLWTTPSEMAKYLIHVNEVHDGSTGIISPPMAAEMLSPGMNGHGLGPAISEDTLRWGHGGADEGFRTQLTSWFGTNNGIIAMVNSDNGSILGELIYAIAKEYDWPGVKADVRKVLEISEERGKNLSGVYAFEEVSDFTIKYEDGHLLGSADFLNESIHLLAETDSTFFNEMDGRPFLFREKEGDFELIVSGTMVGTRIKN